MKLFSPTQAKFAHNKKQEDDISQVAYLTITLQNLQNEINREEQHFEHRLEEQRSLYAEEKIKLQEEVRRLETKRKYEEERLRELMRPIDGLKEQAQEQLDRAHKKIELAEQQEQYIEDLRATLSERFDEIAERQMRAEDVIQESEIALDNLRIKDEMIKSATNSLNAKIAQFESEYQKRTKVLIERENALAVKITQNNAFLEARTAELNAKEVLLNDRLQMLERDITRLKANKK